jgi:hypothetical protein
MTRDLMLHLRPRRLELARDRIAQDLRRLELQNQREQGGGRVPTSEESREYVKLLKEATRRSYIR